MSKPLEENEPSSKDDASYFGSFFKGAWFFL